MPRWPVAGANKISPMQQNEGLNSERCIADAVSNGNESLPSAHAKVDPITQGNP
jgi:hypothetical protein